MSLIVDEHRQYLSDPVRLNVFRRAIQELVRPGDVVADLGSGTGILGLFALAAGASRVYSIETTGMLEIARALARANGYADRFRGIHAHSAEAAIGEPIDLLISDFVGRFGFDADILDIYPDAVARFLRPGGRVLPSDIRLSIAPVERADMHAQVQFWRTCPAGVDVSPAFEWAVNTGYPVALSERDLLGDSIEVVAFETHAPPAVPFDAHADLSITRRGTIHGLGGWMAAQLSPGVTLTNSPRAGERIRRRNVFLPFRAPLDASPGDVLRVRLTIRPSDHIVSWTAAHVSGARISPPQSHTTLRGMLVTREDLARARPDFVPVLSPRGAGRLTTLQLCDGKRTLREVEDAVFDRHQDLFSSRGEAAAFVAEVVSGYSRPA